MLFLIYACSLYFLFGYMNTEENLALKPEEHKIKLQAVFYMISLLVFGISKVYLLAGSITWSDTYVFFVIAPVCITDIAPIAYVLICHHRTFELSA